MLNEFRVHLHVYGIPNCDSCRNTLKWLKTRNVPTTFHNIREEPLDAEVLEQWIGSAHGDYLVNTRSATWRQLDNAERERAQSDRLGLLLDHPTLMKRPVITDGTSILDVGFSPAHLEDYI